MAKKSAKRKLFNDLTKAEKGKSQAKNHDVSQVMRILYQKIQQDGFQVGLGRRVKSPVFDLLHKEWTEGYKQGVRLAWYKKFDKEKKAKK